MPDHYKTLGLNSSATQDEIRRAYRVLARRYHPDVNPGKTSEDKFKDISAAYQVLSDPKKRSEYDVEYDRIQIASFADKFTNQFKKARNAQRTSRPAGYKAPPPPKRTPSYLTWLRSAKSDLQKTAGRVTGLFKKKRSRAKKQSVSSVSILEISVTMKEAIFGQKKTIEIPQTDSRRKVSVNIPAGVKSGSVLRLKENSITTAHEVIVIIRVAGHPFLSLQNKGLVVEVPVSVAEALNGASITLPTLDEPAMVKVPPGSQSGTEIRIKGRGIVSKDGTRGDLIYRLLVKIPQTVSAVGIKDRVSELDRYYEEPVRKNFPSNFFEA